jgi:hypothetical protein
VDCHYPDPGILPPALRVGATGPIQTGPGLKRYVSDSFRRTSKPSYIHPSHPGVQTHTHEGNSGSSCSIDLPIRLGMVGRRKDFFDPELSASCEEELRRELRTVFSQDMTRRTVRENTVVAKGLRYRICGCTSKRNGPREFGKAICHHQQKVVPMIGFG